MNNFERLLSFAYATHLTKRGFCYYYSTNEINFLSVESRLRIIVQPVYDEKSQKVLVEYDQFQGAYELIERHQIFYVSRNSLEEIVQWIKDNTIDNSKGLYPR